MGFPGSSAGKESACSVGDLGLIPGLRISSGEGNGYPLQYFSLENELYSPWGGVAKTQTRLSDFHFHFLGQEVSFQNLVRKKNLRTLEEGK